jgi:hypothetical protein
LNSQKQIAITLVSLKTCKANSANQASPTTEDDSLAVLHRAVMFLIKQGDHCPSATSLDELHVGLIDKHASLSKTQLQSVIMNNPKIFVNDVDGKVGLRECNYEFVRAYFEIADDVAQAVTTQVEPTSYSLTKPCLITFSKQSLMVEGLVCKCNTGNSVLFQFENHTAYQVQHALHVNFAHGQMMRCVLRLRLMVNNYYFFKVTLLFL